MRGRDGIHPHAPPPARTGVHATDPGAQAQADELAPPPDALQFDNAPSIDRRVYYGCVAWTLCFQLLVGLYRHLGLKLLRKLVGYS